MLSLVQVRNGIWQVHKQVTKKKWKFKGFKLPRRIEYFDYLPQPVGWLDDVVVYETANHSHAKHVAEGGDFNENIDVS